MAATSCCRPSRSCRQERKQREGGFDKKGVGEEIPPPFFSIFAVEKSVPCSHVVVRKSQALQIGFRQPPMVPGELNHASQVSFGVEDLLPGVHQPILSV